MPCTIKLLRVPQHEADFHDFDDYDRLIEGARRLDPRAHMIVLLGGDAGLRCGEMMGLEWTDINLERRQLRVQRSEWRGKVSAPKGGRPRVVPLTARLAEALRAHRHLQGSRVLCEEDGRALTQGKVRSLVRRAARLANIANNGVHILRHTFVSHLAMRGAPARAIQELAGHKDLSTSQRYMHLSPAAIEAAISLLEKPTPAPMFGDILETGAEPIPKRRNHNKFSGGGGGNRTRVREQFRKGVYVRSLVILLSSLTSSDRQGSGQDLSLIFRLSSRE